MQKNPVVVITGASSGIGRATALRFARKGSRLVLASRRKDALEQLVDECEACGSEAIAWETDVAVEESVRALANAAVDRFGRIDVWVNDASVSAYAPFLDMPIDDFKRVLDVNVMGYVYGARAALRVMRRQGEGVLINIASLASEIAIPYTVPYNMSKAAVRSLSGGVRQELLLERQKNVHVVSIHPATVDTPFFRHAANYTGRKLRAMPPVYPPKRVAKAIVKAAYSPKDEIVVGKASKAFLAQHRVTPKVVATGLAVETNVAHLSPKERAADTTGILYRPSSEADAAVAGGWGGSTRSALRRVVGWVLLVVGGGLLVLLARPSRRTSRRERASRLSTRFVALSSPHVSRSGFESRWRSDSGR